LQSSSVLSLVRQPLELTLPTVKDDNTTTRHEAAANPGVLQLEHVLNIEERKFRDLVFAVGYCSDDYKKPVLLVTQREPYYHPPFGYIS